MKLQIPTFHLLIRPAFKKCIYGSDARMSWNVTRICSLKLIIHPPMLAVFSASAISLFADKTQ